MAVRTAAIYRDSSSTVQIQALKSSGELNLSDNSEVKASVYTDSSCSELLMVETWVSDPGDEGASRSPSSIVQMPFSLSCSAFSSGSSDCTASWRSIPKSTYYIKTSSGSLESTCSKLVTSNLNISQVQTYNPETGSSEANGYNLSYDYDHDKNIMTNINIETESAQSYAFYFEEDADMEILLESSIGSTITKTTNNDGKTILVYKVGTLESASKDKLSVNEVDGLSFKYDINVSPSMKLAADGLSVYDYLRLEVLTENSAEITVASGGVAPYTYEVLNSTIGSTFVNGVFTAGFTKQYVFENIRVTDSRGHIATIMVGVSEHSYVINNNPRGQTAFRETSVALIPRKDYVTEIETTLSQWSVAGTQLVDSSTVVNVNYSGDSSKIATVSNCRMVNNALTCDLSATENSGSDDIYYLKFDLKDTNGNAIISDFYVYYLRAPTQAAP